MHPTASAFRIVQSGVISNENRAGRGKKSVFFPQRLFFGVKTVADTDKVQTVFPERIPARSIVSAGSGKNSRRSAESGFRWKSRFSGDTKPGSRNFEWRSKPLARHSEQVRKASPTWANFRRLPPWKKLQSEENCSGSTASGAAARKNGCPGACRNTLPSRFRLFR